MADEAKASRAHTTSDNRGEAGRVEIRSDLRKRRESGCGAGSGRRGQTFRIVIAFRILVTFTSRVRSYVRETLVSLQKVCQAAISVVRQMFCISGLLVGC